MAFEGIKYSTKGPVKTYAETGHELSIESVQVCGQKVTFMSFLTAFTQNFTSNWSSEEVYGRIDPIGTFQGNKRTISLTWDVPAGTMSEARQNIKLFSTLFKMIYPSYVSSDNALTLAKSPLVRIKYANLISTGTATGLLGWISSISWNPVLEMGMFQDIEKKLYPKVVSLSLEFNVLHEGGMGWQNNEWKGGKKFPFQG